jgi:uncharacterized membrane protein YtjA (UPF0391 family)
MLFWAFIFLILAIVAGYFGFGQVSEAATTIAIWLFWIFIAVFFITLIAGIIRKSKK